LLTTILFFSFPPSLCCCCCCRCCYFLVWCVQQSACEGGSVFRSRKARGCGDDGRLSEPSEQRERPSTLHVRCNDWVTYCLSCLVLSMRLLLQWMKFVCWFSGGLALVFICTVLLCIARGRWQSVRVMHLPASAATSAPLFYNCISF
jgi:hypothetical protein